MKELNELFVIAWMLFGIYMLVLLLIGADLWSGYRKAKARTSYMLRKTVDKIARYYNALLALTFVDCMQMKDDYRQVAILAAEIAKHKNEPDKMIHAVDDFMNKNNKGNKEEQK